MLRTHEGSGGAVLTKRELGPTEGVPEGERPGSGGTHFVRWVSISPIARRRALRSALNFDRSTER